MEAEEHYTRRPVPFEEIVEELRRFSDRLRLYGIRERGRLGEYRRHIESMIAAKSPLEKTTLFDRLTERDRYSLGIGITEAAELSEVSANLTHADWSCEHLRERLKLVVGGPIHPLLESDGTHQARSAAFELAVATKLKRAGLFPRFAVNPDLSVEFQGTTLLIQCKRPLSRKKVKPNLDRARRQLRQDFFERSPESTVGIIALSLSRTLLSEISPAIGPFYLAPTVSAADKFLGNIILEEAAAHVEEQTKRESCSGIVFHLTAPFYIEEDRGYTWRTRIIVGAGTKAEILEPFANLL